MKKMYLNFAAVAVLFVGIAAVSNAEIGKPLAPIANTNITPALVTEETQLVNLLDKVLPSVVSIVGSTDLGDGQLQTVSNGTGFVVDSNGIILTNRHVVADDKVKYRVYFTDGRRYDATIASRDQLFDVAIVKINDVNLPALTLGNSDNVKIGQTSIAIGNSLGRYPNTVTRGVISGLGRSMTASGEGGTFESLDDLIQTDADINRGNSGGPLLNSRGEVIGINTAIDTLGRGLGFAVPINAANKSLTTYKKFGRVVRPYLGLRYVTITPDIQDVRKLRYDYGALVTAGDPPTGIVIVPDSPAAKAGIKEGDIILSINSKLIRGPDSLIKIIQTYNVGDTIRLKISRNNTLLDLSLTLVEVPTAGLR
jgi:serine protease Do